MVEFSRMQDLVIGMGVGAVAAALWFRVGFFSGSDDGAAAAAAAAAAAGVERASRSSSNNSRANNAHAEGKAATAQLPEVQKTLERTKKLLAQERQARTNAERAARSAVQAEQAASGYTMTTVGVVSSCFPARCGTPRQGLMAPSSRGSIKFASTIGPGAIEDLVQFSHVWVSFIFHENTDVHRGGALKSGKTFPAKIQPPMLGGAKFSVFACRTPHRPNPLGLSVVKVWRLPCILATRAPVCLPADECGTCMFAHRFPLHILVC